MLKDLVYVRSNLQLAISSVAKDSSGSSHPWIGHSLSEEEDDLNIDGDTSDQPIDDRVPHPDEFDDHSSSGFTTPCDIDGLELYDVTSRPQE